MTEVEVFAKRGEKGKGRSRRSRLQGLGAILACFTLIW